MLRQVRSWTLGGTRAPWLEVQYEVHAILIQDMLGMSLVYRCVCSGMKLKAIYSSRRLQSAKMSSQHCSMYRTEMYKNEECKSILSVTLSAAVCLLMQTFEPVSIKSVSMCILNWSKWLWGAVRSWVTSDLFSVPEWMDGGWVLDRQPTVDREVW